MDQPADQTLEALAGDLDDPSGTAEAVDPPVATLQPGQLTEGWRWMLSLGWALTLPALMALGDAAHSLGKPTWWLDTEGTVTWRTVLPFLAPLVAAVAAAANRRWWPIAGGVAVVSLALTALADAGRSPGVAIGEAVLALSGLAITMAAFAGRVRTPQN